MSQKKLGILIAKNSRGFSTGIITDGQLRRATQKLTDISKRYFSCSSFIYYEFK